jgi:hypothetical protein
VSAAKSMAGRIIAARLRLHIMYVLESFDLAGRVNISDEEINFARRTYNEGIR